MPLLRVIYQFFDNISSSFMSLFTRKADRDVAKLTGETADISGYDVSQSEEDINNQGEGSETTSNEISLQKRTLTTKLYMLEQEIEVFKVDFPDEYKELLKQIEVIRSLYYDNLAKVTTEQMTFEIDPELNSRMARDIDELQRNIRMFIETRVKFNNLFKRVQTLITKLNVLYNVSIAHPSEKDKVIAQVERALKLEAEMIQDFKESEYILQDIRLKDQLITLFSYVDYEIFKLVLRNSDYIPETAIKKLILFTKFKDFDYISTFKAFLEDELSDLAELLPLIDDETYRKVFEKRISSALSEIACPTEIRAQLLSKEYWNQVFELESSFIEYLKTCNIPEKDKIKVKIITKLNVAVEEKDVVTSPKSNAYLALVSIFSVTHDDRIWLLIKLFKNLSEDITYKQIYFLVLLFDVMDLIKSTSNTLKRHLEKYVIQYSYDKNVMTDKKMRVLSSVSEKQYIKLFSIDEDVENIVATLEKLDLDFEITSESINVNDFYFRGLESIFLNSSV